MSSTLHIIVQTVFSNWMAYFQYLQFISITAPNETHWLHQHEIVLRFIMYPYVEALKKEYTLHAYCDSHFPYSNSIPS